MTFSKTTWQTGDLITAALLNNTENQYDTYKTDWGYARYSTASTNTVLMKTTLADFGTTHASTPYELIKFMIPPHIQYSRVEYGTVAYSTIGGFNTFLVRVPYTTAVFPTLTSNTYVVVHPVFVTTSAYTTSVTSINILGGQMYAVLTDNTGARLSKVTLTGESTTLFPTSSYFSYYQS